MGLHIRRTGSDDYGKYIKAIIAGPPGAGKTLTASTWKNPFYASAEAGLMSIAHKNLPYLKIERIDDLLHLKILLDEDAETREELFGFPVDTLVVDTLDEIQRMVIRERLEETKQESLKLQDWGYVGETMSAMARGLRNLDMNVVFLLHLKEVNDADSGRLYYKPQLQGAFADQVPGMVDLSLLLRAVTSTQIIDNEAQKVVYRYLQTVPDGNHDWIKDRSGKLPAEVPINFNDDYQRIFDFIYADLDSTMTQNEERILEVSLPKLTPQPAQPIRRTGPPPKGAAVRPTTPRPAVNVPTQPVTSAPAAAVQESLAVIDFEVKNELPEGVIPKQNGSNSGFFCEMCGDELQDKAKHDLSKIKFRKVACPSCQASIVKTR